jgi:hypothetical protein
LIVSPVTSAYSVIAFDDLEHGRIADAARNERPEVGPAQRSSGRRGQALTISGSAAPTQ